MQDDWTLAARRRVLALADRLPAPRDASARATIRAVRDLLTGAPPTSAPREGTDPTVGAPALSVELLERAYESGDEDRIATLVDRLHVLQRRAEDLARPATITDDARLAHTRGAASTQYMIDLLPHLQARLRRHDRWSRLSLLDVGPGTGHGTQLLASLYATNRLGHRIDVTAIDIRDTYRRYLQVIAPGVPFVQQDVFDHGDTYDYVVASHVMEHVPDPVPLSRRLQELAREAVFLLIPYEEPEDELTSGHVQSVDAALIEQFGPDEVTVYESPAWGAFKDPPYRSAIVRLPGLAAG